MVAFAAIDWLHGYYWNSHWLRMEWMKIYWNEEFTPLILMPYDHDEFGIRKELVKMSSSDESIRDSSQLYQRLRYAFMIEAEMSGYQYHFSLNHSIRCNSQMLIDNYRVKFGQNDLTQCTLKREKKAVDIKIMPVLNGKNINLNTRTLTGLGNQLTNAPCTRINGKSWQINWSFAFDCASRCEQNSVSVLTRQRSLKIIYVPWIFSSIAVSSVLTKNSRNRRARKITKERHREQQLTRN